MKAPSGRSRCCRSSSAAPSVLVRAPVARPCTTRAASSQPTPSATRNSDHGRRLEHEGADEHRTSADVVGEAADDEQRGEQGEGVDAEHRRQHAGAEAELLLVDAVQRRGDARGGQHEHEQHGHGPEGGGPWEATAGHGHGQGARAPA